MKTLTLDDSLYTALQEESARTGRPVNEIVTEAVQIWFIGNDRDEASQSEHDRQSNRELFDQLATEWIQERPRGADIAGLVMHPSYQRIIGMGETAIPLILKELEARPDHWFWALYSITGANPVDEGASGNLKKMAAAWLEWGHESGYLDYPNVD